MSTTSESPTREERIATNIARLKVVMERHKMTQAQLAQYLGVPTPTICNWLQGTREMNGVVLRLLDILGMLEALAPALHRTLLPK